VRVGFSVLYLIHTANMLSAAAVVGLHYMVYKVKHDAIPSMIRHRAHHAGTKLRDDYIRTVMHCDSLVFWGSTSR
jgi:hypothetical protein